MLRRTLLLIALAFALIPVRAGAQTWAEYRPAGGGFALEMPDQWKTEVMNIDTAVGQVKGYTATVEVGAVGFMSMYIPYPPDAVRGRPVEGMLDGARDGAVANVHGRLRSEEKITVDNHPGRQIIIDAPNDMVLVQKFFVLDAKLIQAIVGGHPGVEKNSDAIRFLQSLKVVSP